MAAKLRAATPDDVHAIVAFVKECHGCMHWSDYGLSPDVEDVQETFRKLIESNDCDVAVVEDKRGILGLCAMSLHHFLWNKQLIIASEWAWHMRPSLPDDAFKRRWFVMLFRHMKSWAISRGATHMKINTAPQFPAVSDFLERNGLPVLETVQMGVLHGC